MSPAPVISKAVHGSYDVVIIGGAIIGSSVAWHLSKNPDFDGRILVVEKDPSYAWCSTAHTNSCIRQQFSKEINIRISQYGAEFVKNFRAELGGDPEVPEITFDSFGYLFLADTQSKAAILRENQQVQATCGAGTVLMSPEEIASAYPFYNLDDIVLGSHNLTNEGYFDGNTLFDWLRRKARQNGAEYLTGEVTAIQRSGGRIDGVTLGDGQSISAGCVINCSGPRAGLTAQMAGLHIPVEPRRRFTFVFDAQTPLTQELPLTIDPSGVHMRSDGRYYLAGCPPEIDVAVPPDDFREDHEIWEEKIWPALANRVPAFESIRLLNSWVGHYAFNTLDQNAIVGWHPEVRNFMFVNGFSGHGLQQSPAMGRGAAELLIHGEYRTLDLSPLGYERIMRNEPFLEKAII